MSADLLRKAASLMRERAEAATEFSDYVSWVLDSATGETADHIISWRPNAALAVANLLETVAANLVAHQAHPEHPFDADGYVDAVAIARAYLGSES